MIRGRSSSHRPFAHPRRAFTLVELLVVITIIALVAVSTIPLVMPSLQQQQVAQGARFIYGELAQARDRAIRDNAPRGIRLLPDPPTQMTTFNGVEIPDPLGPVTASRIVAIERPNDYTTGKIRNLSTVPFYSGSGPAPAYYYFETSSGSGDFRYSLPPLDQVPYSYGATINSTFFRTWIIVAEAKFSGALPNSPTCWFWNIRQGERLQFEDTGRNYTIAGPMSVGNTYGSPLNPQRQINNGTATGVYSLPVAGTPSEFLVVLDGLDNDGDGYIDEAFDGIDNDLDGVIDPGFNGLDDNGNGMVDEPMELFFSANGSPSLGEYEPEKTLGRKASTISQDYSISRLPVPASDAREVGLPRGVKIDLTSWNAASRSYPANSTTFPFVPERSRLPVDPYTGYVDILIDPSGKLINTAANASPGPSLTLPYYHIWLADDKDIHGAFTDSTIASQGIGFQLPMPLGTTDDLATMIYPYGLTALEGTQRIVSINTRTGRVETHTPVFSLSDLNRPYEAAQQGAKEEP